MQQITITIDGPAGSGKGTTAKGVAEKLGYKYLDTGAMYRAVALALSEHHIRPTNTAGIEQYLDTLTLAFDTDNHILINNIDRESDIRNNTISTLSSTYAAIPEIRTWVVERQQIIISEGGFIIDGRDAGSVIAPQAELKIYLDCSVAIRAQRRAQDYKVTDTAGIKAIEQDLQERDNRDMNRTTSPLQILPDSVVINTGNLTIKEQIDQVHRLALEKINS